MIVTIDNNLTTYEYGKSCKVSILKIYKDGCEQYLFEYGRVNTGLPSMAVWSNTLPVYLSILVRNLFTYIGFDRNINESDVISVVCIIRNYIKRRNSRL